MGIRGGGGGPPRCFGQARRPWRAVRPVPWQRRPWLRQCGLSGLPARRRSCPCRIRRTTCPRRPCASSSTRGRPGHQETPCTPHPCRSACQRRRSDAERRPPRYGRPQARPPADGPRSVGGYRYSWLSPCIPHRGFPTRGNRSPVSRHTRRTRPESRGTARKYGHVGTKTLHDKGMGDIVLPVSDTFFKALPVAHGRAFLLCHALRPPRQPFGHTPKHHRIAKRKSSLASQARGRALGKSG